MSDPFGALGGMGGLLGGFQKQMQQLQAEAEREEVEATAGGLVTVRMNGAQEVLSVRIDPKAMDDRELVEDLLRAATNEAVRRSKQVVAAKLGQLASAMGLPPGLLG
jgi:DNA-binding YbaB/EbfC family protein